MGTDGTIYYGTGNAGTVYGSGSDSRTVLHETMHLMGLSDRYTDADDNMTGGLVGIPHPGFSDARGRGNNIMSTEGTRLNYYQYEYYARAAQTYLRSFYFRDVAPGFDRFVDRDQTMPREIPNTPFEDGGIHMPNPNK